MKNTQKCSTQKKFSRALIATCSLLLLFLSCIGAIEGMVKAQADAPHVLSASTSAAKPSRTPPGRHTPTPAPSPTLAVTLTTIPTMTANTTPPIHGATPQATQKHGGSPMPPPISTQPTPSTTSTVRHTSSKQQEGNPPLSLVILSTLSGIGGVILILAIALLLLRKYLLAPAKVKLAQSGAPPWQRMRINSLDDPMSNSEHNWQIRQTLDSSSPNSNDCVPTTDDYSTITRNVIPSRRGFSSTTSRFVLKKLQLKLPTAQLLRPTRLKQMPNSGIVEEPDQNAFNLCGQNSQPGAVLREPGEERDLDQDSYPSLDDPYLQETLRYYMLRGELARQSKTSEQQEQEL